MKNHNSLRRFFCCVLCVLCGSVASASSSVGGNRLEEMKVELALLSDSATFPYFLGVRSSGPILEVHGDIPHESNRQRALQLARQNTALQVLDGMTIKPGRIQRPPLRGSQVLQREGESLLARTLGDAARHFQFEARPNGMAIVRGCVDSVEEKLAISRIFYQLPGCTGVDNQLVLQPILRDGQRFAQVTKDGSQLTATSAQATARLMPSHSGALPTFPGSLPAASHSVASSANSWAAQEEELRLPTTAPSRVRQVAAVKPTPRKREPGPSPTNDASANAVGSVDVLTAPKTPESWSRPSTPRQAEIRVQAPPLPSANRVRPAMAWESVNRTKPAAPPTVSVDRPAIRWECRDPAQSAQKSAAPPVKPIPVRQAKRENRSLMVTAPNRMQPEARPLPSAQSSGNAPPVRPAFRWPPAHPPDGPPPRRPMDVPLSTHTAPPPAVPVKPMPPPPAKPVPPPPAKPSATVGRPGTITFEEASEPAAKKSTGHPGSITFEETPTPAANRPAVSLAPPIAPADLKRKVIAVCGRQARDVQVEMQRDGSILVQVRAANSFAERQLTRKILTIPEMASPRVRLTTQIGP